MDTTPPQISLTLNDMRKLVMLAGFKASAGCWEDDYKIFAFSVETLPDTFGHPRFALEYRKDTRELFLENRPYYPARCGVELDPAAVTTEDLVATCKNYPATTDALVAAITLERRIGPNEYTTRVARINEEHVEMLELVGRGSSWQEAKYAQERGRLACQERRRAPAADDTARIQ